MGGLRYIHISRLNQVERGQCVSDHGKVLSFPLGEHRKKVHIYREKKKPHHTSHF